MKYLLDTHTIIWHFEDSPRLSRKAIEIIDNPENNIYISSISLWEIAIKMNIGKLDVDFSINELLDEIKDSDFEILQIENKYLQRLSSLPFIHRDPFDRLLIATASAENISILTADDNIHKYDIKWIW